MNTSPLTETHSQIEPGGSPVRLRLLPERISVLVVDDDQLDRMAVRRALQTLDIVVAVTEVDNSQAAFDRFAYESFDCILLDYRLPPTDGLVVLRELRSRGLGVPIVVLTGQGDEQVAVDLMKAGATDYLTKDGLSPERLGKSILTAVRVHRAEMLATQAREEIIQRMRFLTDASRLLSASLDMQAILDKLALLIVPEIADWCSIDLFNSPGQIERVIAHPDKFAATPWISELAQTWPASLENNSGVARVLRGGQLLVYPSIEPDSGASALPDSLLRQVSFICVPINIHSQCCGALTLMRGMSKPYGMADLALARDLAQRLAMAFDNAQLYQEARTAIRLRDEFLSIASHELRTPLTSLLGYVQLLQRRVQRSNEITERENRAMQVIVDQVLRLNRMISTLLDVSRLQGGQFNLQKEEVDLAPLIMSAVEEIRPTLDKHTIELSGELPPLLMLGDELRLHQAFQNLLQNAIKYSPGGGHVKVSVNCDDGWGCVTVKDEGIGIPKEALPHLFSRFYRAPNAEERHINGIGLGLYVVHQIVALHAGTVEVSSELGEGSAFTVKLPLLTT